MDLQLTGKRAVVTGGSRGIGLAVAGALAAEGADVVLVSRDHAGLDTAAGRIRRPRCHPLLMPAAAPEHTSQLLPERNHRGPHQ